MYPIKATTLTIYQKDKPLIGQIIQLDEPLIRHPGLTIPAGTYEVHRCDPVGDICWEAFLRVKENTSGEVIS